MSAASLRVLLGLISRDSADLDIIDTWATKKLVTTAEAETARTAWHERNDPPPATEATQDKPAVETA